MRASTPTGVPVIECGECGCEHPVSRRHCRTCGVPSAFINASGYCLTHRASRPTGGQAAGGEEGR